jgi:PAS domain S-box-containing protein
MAQLQSPGIPLAPTLLAQQLELFVINADEPTMIVGLDLNIIAFNRQFSEQYLANFGSEIEKGKCILDYAQLTAREELKEMYRAIFAGGLNEKEVSMKFPGKDQLTFLLKYKPGYDEQNKIFGAIIRFADITDKVITRKLLVDTEIRYKSLLENTSDAFVAFDEHSRYTYFNTKAAALITKDAQSLIGKNVWEVSPDAVDTAFYKDFNRAMKERVPVISTNYYAPLDLWMENHFYPTENGLSLITRNITQKVKADARLVKNEQRLKEAQAITHIGSWEINFNTNTSIWSDEAYRIYGIEPGDHKLSYEDWMSFIHPEDMNAVLAEIKRSQELLCDSSFHHRIIRKDGTVRHINSQSRFELNSEGRPIGLIGAAHDITERVKAEKELVLSHNLLLKLTEKVPVAVYQFEMDPDGNMSFPFISPAIEQLLPGTDLDSVHQDATLIFASMHPDDMEKMMISINESRRLLADWDLEFRALNKNGGITWIKGSSRPEKKENGSVVWYGYLQNITERKLWEEDIKIAKERYDLVAKATNEVIWDWDINADTIQWGEGFKTMLGYEYTNADNSLASWLEHIHPKDKEEVYNSVLVVINSKTFNQWQQEYAYKKADGSYTEVFDRGFVIRDLQGKAIRMIGAMQDITERKRASENTRLAKERYDLVAKATNDAIYDWDLVNNEVIRMGDGLEVLFGHPAEKVNADPEFWKSIVHPEDLEPSYAKLNRALQNPKESICNHEYRLRRADGTYAYVFDKGFIIRDKKGKAIRMIGATQDISHRKESEALLTALNEKLEKRAGELAVSNAELEQFAYIASHDLQEPLRMVTSFLTQLENKYKEKLDDKAKQYIHFATDGAARMRRIILDLLEYSRVGRESKKDELIDTHELIFESVQLNRILIEEKDALIDWKNMPTVNGNKASLQQLFQNLLGNALKYQKANEKPIVTLSASETPSHWQFAVADNGIGIESRFFDKIFVVFQRLHNRNEYSGTGIGLAICKKIVENHNGRIWVESEVGMGSTFYFTIAK